METISGQFCPACKFKNDLTATVCVYCGASLENVRSGEKLTTRRVDEGTKVLEAEKRESFSEEMIPPKGIAIYTENRILVGIRQEKEFFLGRKVDEAEDGLVDLIPVGAFQQGVSRQHAMIRRVKRAYEIIDLGSTNGTYMDGNRLVSNQAYPLPSTSKIALGRMQLLVLYNPVATKDKTLG